MYPEELNYSKEHEWVSVDGDKVRIGVTEYAQNALGDVVFVELPEEGDQIEVGGTLGAIESVKAVSDIYSPVSGEVIAVNEDLLDAPEKINKDPYKDGWILEIKIVDKAQLDDLMTASQYQEFIKEEE